MPHNIRTVTDLRDFRLLREEWDRLLAESRNRSVFLTWEWMYSWWEVFGKGSGDLHILVARDPSGSLLGIAPLMERRLRLGFEKGRSLEFLGAHSVSSEYLDFVSRKGLEREMAETFVRHVLDSGEKTLLGFHRVPEESETARLFSGNDPLFVSFLLKEEEAYYIDLPPDWGSYLDSLGKNTHRNIKRYRSRIDCALGATLGEYRIFEEGILGEVIDLHQKRMTSMGRIGSFASESFVRFHRTFSRLAAERGWLRVYFMKSGDRNIAMRYGFLYGDTFYDYSTGFDPQYEKMYVGFVLLSHCIERCILEKARRFDFLGPGLYKERWNSESRRKRSYWTGNDVRFLDRFSTTASLRRSGLDFLKNLIPPSLHGDVRNIKNRVLIRFGKPLK